MGSSSQSKPIALTRGASLATSSVLAGETQTHAFTPKFMIDFL
jgi:hypothetical protein